jgi:branched-chain amino acid transport system substrate-binding protein
VLPPSARFCSGIRQHSSAVFAPIRASRMLQCDGSSLNAPWRNRSNMLGLRQQECENRSMREETMRSLIVAIAALLAGTALSVSEGAFAQDRTVKITGFGAKSGVVRVFGVNSEAALKAAAEEINKSGGVTLGDGTKAKLTIDFLDDRCNAEEGISVVRRIASTDAFVAVGPTCSNVAESLFGILQKKVGDASDSGLQFPIIADVAAKGGLAKISEWAFRNVPSEFEMYKSLFAWVKSQHPSLKTIYGGVEKDFAHSNATYGVMKSQAEANGYQVAGTAEWLLNDTTFSNQVRDMKRANADIVAISAHPFTTCGVLKEMERQGVKPKLLIGLTSSSSIETLQGCAKQAEGIIIPTSFAPVTPEATKAAEQVAKFGGSADLHSAAAYEIMFILKDVIEQQKIMAKPDTVQADRAKMRQGLAALKETKGLLGKVGRTDDREAIKPFLYVHAKGGSWLVLHKPSS